MFKALWVAAALLLQGAAPAQNSDFKVSGIVVREDKQEPDRVPNADRILLRGSGPSKIAEIGSGGAFEFTGVRPGAYQIVVGPAIAMEPIRVAVADKDISGLRVLVPDVVALKGTITVEGGGPSPRFQIAFTRIDAPPPAPAPINVPIASTFAAQLHTGQYRIAPSGLPQGYSVKSVTVGTADVFTQPLKLSTGDSGPIVVTLGVASPPPWIKVSGRVTAGNGTPPVTGLSMSGPVAEALSTTVKPDGSFEFPKVLPGSYTVLAVPANATSGAATVKVGTSDVTNLEIRIPPPKEVAGRIVVQGNVPIPNVVFAIAPLVGIPGTGASLPANPQSDGSFRIALPQGERQITPVTGALPAGYALASFTYGMTDLLKNPLRVSDAGNAELRVTFDTKAVTPVKVSGRVAGLLTTKGVRVVLASPVLPSVEASVNPDGSFAFSKVVPGNYGARLSLSGISAGTSISVGNKDVTDAVITYPRDFVVTGHILVEGGGANASPEVLLEVKSAAGVSRTSNAPGNGVIMLNVKDGEYNVSIRSMPAGYQLKSIMYGTTDLLKSPLKIDGPVTWEIIVRIAQQLPAR